MYHTSMYTVVEISTFHTGLNTGRIGHITQFRAIPTGTDYFLFIYFFFLSFVIFEFLLGQNGN